ncbi:hypothetical protein D9756_008286 [Leucocoprinus leucothites]|uniref:Uncharacterized protein n=1 Tax=Leucocoprinus leucothites TaxID=201217 RepID=A0A8H5D2U8_9AGAR|nr:hypothetical protein D9756_008286 [Leucoagaricus leucothites]
MVSFTNKSIDDTSSSILYEPAQIWTHLTGQSGAFDGTLSTVISPRSFAITFTFPEPAVAVYYYGSGGKGNQGLCVDCDVSHPRPGLNEVLDIPDSGGKQILLWSKHFDTPGKHTVYISGSGLDDDDEGHPELFVDRFVLEVPVSGSGGSTSSSSSTTKNTTTSSKHSQTTRSTSTIGPSSASTLTTGPSSPSTLTIGPSSASTLTIGPSNSSTLTIGPSSATTTTPSTAQSPAQTSNAGRSGPRVGALLVGGLVFVHAICTLYL